MPYAFTVGTVGALTLLCVVCSGDPVGATTSSPYPLIALSLGLLLSELMAVPVSRKDATISPVTISTTFAVALVVLGPLSVVLICQAVAVAVDDVRSRRRPSRSSPTSVSTSSGSSSPASSSPCCPASRC